MLLINRVEVCGMADESQEHEEETNQEEPLDLVEAEEDDETDELEVDESDEVDELEETETGIDLVVGERVQRPAT